jgi:hypothetical protein
LLASRRVRRLSRTQQFAEAESFARDMVADQFRQAGAGCVPVDVGLDAAMQVADMQVKAWEQAGYTQEEIDAELGPEFAKWAVGTAAELARQASIAHRALGKV